MIKTCFSAKYSAETPTASMRKLAPVARAAEAAGYAELIDPSTIDISLLKRLHDPAYVEEFVSGVGERAESQGWPWTREIRDGVLAMQAGQLRAAQDALAHGIAANIAQGFHHSTYKSGGGFCTFNGLALVAQEFPHKTVCVLDCDQHGGNGTQDFTRRLSNLRNYTINGTAFGGHTIENSICCTLPAVTNCFQVYLDALQQAFRTILKWKPDLLIYQAGMDPHIDDPLGSLGMTTEQLLQRDCTVFSFCHREKIPTFFVLAGGYQEPIDKKLVPLHVNTFKAAHEIYVENVTFRKGDLNPHGFARQIQRLAGNSSITISQK